MTFRCPSLAKLCSEAMIFNGSGSSIRGHCRASTREWHHRKHMHTEIVGRKCCMNYGSLLVYRWKVRSIWLQGRCMMEEGTHGPLNSQVSQVSCSKYGIKRGKVRLAEKRGILEEDRRVGQEGRSSLFERRNSACTSKASEYGVCIHCLP